MSTDILFAIGLGLNAANTIVGGLQQAANARAQARAAEAAASEAAIRGEIARRSAEEETRRTRREGERQIGALRAGFGGSGLADFGVDVLADQAAEIELAAQDALFKGALAQFDAGVDVSFARAKAKRFRQAAGAALAGSIIGAGSDTATSVAIGRHEGIF